MSGAYPTREAVATTRVNDVIFSDQVFMNPAEQLDVRFEGDLTTSDRYDNPADASPPTGDSIEQFDSSMGHLLDVFFFAPFPSVQLKLYQAIDFFGGGGWRLVDQWLLTPSVVFKLQGYRIDTSYTKLSLVNAGSSIIVGEFQVRMSSL